MHTTSDAPRPAHAGAPAAPRYTLELRVYWEDTDAGGIVYYANYLRFFERARTEWLRSLGIDQERWRHEAGTQFVVTDAAVHYHRPARLDDLLHIEVALRHQGRASLELDQVARRGSERLVDATVRIGCVDARDLRPKRLPPPLLELMTP